jgi:cell division protein FtsL
MTQRKLKPWMRHERVFIWIATIVTFLVVAGAITYRAIS